ncbi:MAG TPA: hypothetical protein VHD83_08825 [Puia sp.]|nr:hypothetical protein [Puia sp.]
MAKDKTAAINLPDVKDIPGQEHIRAPRLGELADNTPSSADEEGDDVLESKDDELVSGNDADVTAEERRALEDIDNREADTEDEVLSEARLDDVDDDGDPLNEESFGDDVSGEDLDVPGAEEDDLDEEIGEEDEENNEYSLNDDNGDIEE